MQPEKRDPAYVWDMLQAAKEARDFVQGATFHRYQSDKMMRRAVERQIQTIGEAAARISKPFREKHAEIPWNLIIGQRNVLVHDYGEILDERIFRVATEKIPELIAVLEKLLPGQ
jgi:uncharacterized protein with HEPN domain